MGGGVAIYFKTNIAVRRHLDLESKCVENICIEILHQPERVILCAIYKPPNKTVDKWNSIKEHMQNLCTQNIPNIIVVGDMNEDWLKQSPKPKLHTIYKELSLTQHIKTATRISRNSATLIDHMVTNLQSIVDSCGTIPCDLSDHHAIYLHLNWRQNLIEKQSREIWYYNQGNYTNLNAEYSTQDWNETINIDTMHINVAYTNFIEKIINIARKHIPTRNIIINPMNKPWYTSEMRKLKNKMLRFRKNAQRSHNEMAWEKYRRTRNELNSKIRRAKSEYPEKFEKAELLNKYFINQTNLEDQNVPSPLTAKKTLKELSEIIITPEEVRDQLKTVNVNQSQGPDKISPYILNKCWESLSFPVWKLINWSVESETLPYWWKRANITPIHKKGERDVVGNYRPVALTSIICKILEKILFKHIYNFLSKEQLISN